MLSEYDNILTGRPLQHPDQFRPAPRGTFLPSIFRALRDHLYSGFKFIIPYDPTVQLTHAASTGENAALKCSRKSADVP